MVDGEGVLVRHAGSGTSWVNPETSAYDDEAHLQKLLVDDPARVPGVGPQALAVDELSTSGGPIDVCIVDTDGSVTVVECKLASNRERRRMVIGQVIDYASAIWSDGPEAFAEAWRQRGKPDLTAALDAESFAALKRNLADGHINLCLAVDAIDDDLRRLVEYLSKITLDQISVTALQLAYARHGDFEILIPSTYGAELAAAKTRTDGTRKPRWTRETFLDAIATHDDRQIAERYFELVESLAERQGPSPPLWYGNKPNGGVFLHPYGLRYAPFQLWLNTARRLMIYGNWKNWPTIAGHDGFADLAKMLGQDHRGSSKAVPADTLGTDAFWTIALTTATTINQTHPPDQPATSDCT